MATTTSGFMFATVCGSGRQLGPEDLAQADRIEDAHADVLDNAAGGDPTKLKKLKVRFSRNVLPGDTVSTSGWLKEDAPTHRIVGLEAQVDRGDVVIRDAWAEVAK